jgi:hypothetical protein
MMIAVKDMANMYLPNSSGPRNLAESIKKVLRNHGVQEPFFGVKIGDMKKIQKRIKKDYQLALDLYDTGIYDAMYLAGLIADDAKMTKRDLQRWIDGGLVLVCDRYTASSVAYGEAQGLDPAWLTDMQRFLPPAALTIIAVAPVPLATMLPMTPGTARIVTASGANASMASIRWRRPVVCVRRSSLVPAAATPARSIRARSTRSRRGASWTGSWDTRSVRCSGRRSGAGCRRDACNRSPSG